MRKLSIVVVLVTCVAAFTQQTPSRSRVLEPPPTMQVAQAFENQIIMLDGLKCTKCSFKNLTLVYSGGKYELKDATFSGTIVVELHGAAENGLFTVSELSLLKPDPRKTIRFDAPRTMSLKNMW